VLPVILLLVTLAIVIGARVIGPSDIHDKSQPKTVAYTADMVLNGRWVLPRDMVGGPARKPPMYNWIGAPFVAIFGFAEPVLKMPSILSGVAIVGLTIFITRRLLDSFVVATLASPLRAEDPEATQASRLREKDVFATSILAGIIWLASYPTFSLMYVARPDMPMIAFLTAAWVIATIILKRGHPEFPDHAPGDMKPHVGKFWMSPFLFWLCVAGAALSKGPPALLPIIYVLVAAKPLSGRWSSLRRFHFEWGVPLFVLLFGAWVFGAWRSNPQHFWDVLVGEEVTSRFSDGEPLDPYRVHKPFWLIFTWYALKFAPWSILTGLALLLIPPRRWFSHPMTPAMLWIAVVLIFFAIPEGKRIDYLAPAYPAGAALSAYVALVLLRRMKLNINLAAAGCVVLVCFYTRYQWTASPEAVGQFGEHVKTFARDVCSHVRPGERIVFAELGFHPLQTLMGMHQTDPPTDADFAQRGWLIAAVRDFRDMPDVKPVIVSDDIQDIQVGKGARIFERRSGRLGLYRLPLPRPTTEEPATTRRAISP
jgi:4-amino-4-deoxy-L-arabinose transferase-like glycosyltransferase